MCELMGICANLEVNAQFSFKEILTRGGGTKPDIGDGWGMGLYTGACSTVYKEPKAAFDSKLAKKIGNMEFKSKIFVSHIRQMAGSRRSLENTHPFERRLFDQDWLFAHNGKDGLGAYYNSHPKVRDCFKPKGETGSE